MQSYFYLVAAILATSLANDAEYETTTDELVFVQAIWRHGDRSPTKTFPSDKYQEDFWPQGWGQLSAAGLLQHVDLGKSLRKRYIEKLKFLSNEYNSHEIYVRSTDVNRTLMSAMANMIGMYPKGNRVQVPSAAEWPRNLAGELWMPIPIHTVKKNTDYTVNADRDCPYFDQLWEEIKKSDECLKLKREQSEFFDYVSFHANKTIDPFNLWIIQDSLFIEKTNNLTLPNWVTNVVGGNASYTYYDKISDINDLIETWYYGLALNKVNGIDMSIEVPKVRGGPLLETIIMQLEQKWACYQKQNVSCIFFDKLKYYAYSAHDSTISSLFSVLGFKKIDYNRDGYPRYSSCVTIELWKNATSGGNYVKFLYWPLVGTQYHTTIIDITGEITGSITDIDSLKARSQIYKPLPSAAALCNKIKNNASSLVTLSTVIAFVFFYFVFVNERA